MKAKKNWLLLSLAGLALASCSSRKAEVASESDRDPSAARASVKPWYLSGYLPEKPDERVFLRIQGDKIVAIEAKAPAGGVFVLRTDAFIFPGLMDMHGHVKYNILPLWNDARSQFLNRYEWRKKYPPYKDATSLNMKPIKGHTVCAAVRWAELKAIAGGATAIQGIGTDGACAKEYGVRNIDVQGEFDARKIRNLTDIVSPDYISSIIIPFGIEDRMKKGMSYEKAFEDFLKREDFGGGMTVREWFDLFQSGPYDLATGLKLLVGDDFNVRAGDVTKTSFTKLAPSIRAHLASHFGFKLSEKDAQDPKKRDAMEKKVVAQLAAMEVFLFGKASAKGFLQLSGPMTDDNAADFLSKGGTLTIPSSVRRFIGMWEWPTRRSVAKFFRETNKPVVFTHLGEGRRDDAYNNSEWSYLKRFGLTFPGMVIIHGVGMNATEIADAARSGMSFVRSPFSNLLLYGETLRVDAALRAKANVTLGSDWSPTGSKNILDELRLARRYAQAQRWNIPDKTFVEMVTINAAKALRVEDRFGKVAPNFVADLTLVSRTAGRDPYTTLVESEQQDIELVVVGGEAVFGEADAIREVVAERGGGAVDELPASCKFKKAFRYAWDPAYDAKKAGEPPIKTAKQIERVLNAATNEYRRTLEAKDQAKIAKLDPLFNCEDPTYSKRFEDYVEKELPSNVSGRSGRRSRDKLVTGWSPLKSTEGSEEDGAETDEMAAGE